jgi:hypothetical protein
MGVLTPPADYHHWFDGYTWIKWFWLDQSGHLHPIRHMAYRVTDNAKGAPEEGNIDGSDEGDYGSLRRSAAENTDHDSEKHGGELLERAEAGADGDVPVSDRVETYPTKHYEIASTNDPSVNH